MNLDNLLGNAQTVAIICNQFGDTGKGKFSDVLASHWADVIARGTGGNNAGHTVVVDGKEKIFHLLPAGIAHDSSGKINILGNGMVIDPTALVAELDELDGEGATYDHLMISQDAHVIMPWHIARDRTKYQSQSDGGVGSTGRGIGPCYEDKIGRRGVTIGDLLDRDTTARKIEKAKAVYPEKEIDTNQVIATLDPSIEKIKPFVRDTVTEMHGFMRAGKRILLEGAQGLLLSVEHGTYPFVTSSDCSLNGTASGVGLSAQAIDLSFGIVKFPFMTRVGAGPFPTEFAGRVSEDYCARGLEHDIFYEVREYLGMPLDLTEVRIAQKEKNSVFLATVETKVRNYIARHKNQIVDLFNTGDEFEKGVAIRLAAGEYGATTKRPRRTGWTDAVAARYAVGINGPLMILTKVDALAGMNEFNVTYEYKTLNATTTHFSRENEFLRSVQPTNTRYDGFGEIRDVRNYDGLPSSLRQAVTDFEQFTGGKVAIISVGPDREETIVR
jgi:adenylosuccinate synthase